MTPEEIRAAVLDALRRIAPEIDPSSLRGGDDLRQQADIDSVDFLNFLTAVHERLGVDVPEADYARVRTLDDCVRYIAERMASSTQERG